MHILFTRDCFFTYSIHSFIRETAGSYKVARSTAEFYRTLISSVHWKTPEEAISMIHLLGIILTQAQPIGMLDDCFYFRFFVIYLLF